jgi:hypothetical protein
MNTPAESDSTSDPKGRIATDESEETFSRFQVSDALPKNETVARAMAGLVATVLIPGFLVWAGYGVLWGFLLMPGLALIGAVLGCWMLAIEFAFGGSPSNFIDDERRGRV